MNGTMFDGEDQRRRLAVGLVVLLTTAASGCADLVISDADLARITDSVQRAVATSACDTPLEPLVGNETIDIEFTKENGHWCPKRQVEACPQVFQSKQVQWRSVAKDESDQLHEVDARFKVYFTPFKGDAFTAAKGRTEPGNFDLDAPAGVYKYTVWDWPTGKESHKCTPLDPNFRVHR